jgi:hypothetical protein
MKRTSYFLPIGLLLFLLLCLVPGGEAQSGTPIPYANSPAQLALSWTFNANSTPTGGFTVAGLRYWQIAFVPIGTVSTCSLSLDSSVGSGFTTGGIITSSTVGSCAAAGEYASASATTPTQLGQLTPTITGSGSVYVVLLGYTNNPGASGSASSTIVSPLDGSGFVEVNCKTGCAGSNPNGQAVMANSSPVVIASNQSAVPASESGTWNVGLNAGSNTVGAFTGSGVFEVGPTTGANTKTNPFFENITDGTNDLTAALSAWGTPPTGTEVLGINANLLAPADGSGYIEVNCKTGCSSSGGSSVADEGTFTQGTTSLTAIGGIYSTSITNLTTGQAGAVQLTNDRNMFVNLNKVGGSALALGQTTMSASVPVAIASNQGALSVSQATAANLNATVVGSGVFEVGPTGSANTKTNPFFSNITDGTNDLTAALSAWGTAPTGTEVMGVNANVLQPVDGSGYVEVNCKTGCSSSGGSSIADEAAFTQGTTSFTAIGGIYSTSITNLTTGQAGAVQLTNDRNMFVNFNKLAGTALGAPSNYGTSPGAVEVQGVNAFITNTPAVSESGTWNVGLNAGSNTIGAVTQASGPWTINTTQLNGSALGSPSNYGTSPGAVAVQGVNAFITNTPTVSGSGVFEVGPTGSANTKTNPFFSNITDGTNDLTAALSAWGTAPTGTEVMGVNANVLQPVDGSGYVEVNCKTGCSSSGGSSLTDEGTFTQGTTSFTAIGGIYNSSITNLSSGQGGAVQLTNDRNMFVNLNKVGGTAISLYTTLFNATAATGTATSSAVRLPGASGYGTLQITGASITGSPSGCQIALAYQPNTGSPNTSAQATISFTPGNSTQNLAVNPTTPSGDQYVATYTCSTYPTAGTISVSFAATQPNNLVTWGGSALGAPSNYGTSPGAVTVPGVNAFITNTPAVTQSGTWNVGLNAGSNTVGSVDIQGNAGVALDAAQNAAAPANNLNVAGVFNNNTGTTSALTAGHSSAVQLDNHGLALSDVASVNGAALSKTNPLFANISDGTNDLTAALSAWGTAPTGTEVLGVNANVLALPALPTGSNTIGAVNIAASQTIAVTQATAANLNATVVGTGTFVVQDSADMAGTTPATAPSKTLVTGGIYNSSAPTPTTGQTLPFQLDSSGNLQVDVKAGSAGNAAASATGSAVPGSADYSGLNVSGTLRGWTAVNPTGSVYAAQMDLSSVAGTTTVTAASGVAMVGIEGHAAATLDSTVGAGTAPTNDLVTGSLYNTSAPAPTNGQAMAVQADQAGNQLSFPGVQFKSGAAWTSGTSVNTLQYPTGTTTIGQLSGVSSVLVQLDQTTTLTGGAVTFQGTYDNTNWVTIPTAQVLNPNTFAALTNPYTFVASTNQAFLIQLQGYVAIRANLTTVITGTGSVTPYWTTLSSSSPILALLPNQSVNLAQVGGTAPVLDPCQANAGSQAVINLTASGQVITGTASKQTYICSIDLVSATAQNIALVEGTVTTCGTGTAGMAGGATAATGWNFAANSGLVKGTGSNWVFKTATAADNVCLLLSSTGQTSGAIRYVQQ